MMENGKKYAIIPQPKSLKETEGVFYLPYDAQIVLSSGCGNKEYKFAKLLANTVKEATGISLNIGKAFEGEKGEIFIEKKEGAFAEQSYLLVSDDEKIVISAGDSAGILYGVQTLRQLFEQCGAAIPCVKIEDTPKLQNRGFFHDATRGRVQTLESYKKLADTAVYYKLNQLQLYVEHTYMFKNFSEVWRDDTPLTSEDILELDAYCNDLCIELVPSLASFGHLDKVLKTKSFAELCELPDSDKDRFTYVGRMEHHTLNISDDKAFEFVKRALLEFMPLFSSKKFNLNGDETFDLGKGRSKDYVEKVGKDHAYVGFVKKICDFLIENGKEPLFWGDIIVGSPKTVNELPQGVTCLTWGYAENEQDNSARLIHESGCRQYLCPGVHGWRHFINRLNAAYNNISRMCSYAVKYDAIGLLTTDWGDYGHLSHPLFSVPGLIYGAEGAWNGKLSEREPLNENISLVQYCDRTGRFVDIVSKLAEQEGIAWEHIVQYMEYMTNGTEHETDARKEFLGNCHIDKPIEKNERIDELVKELTALSGKVNERGKEVIYSYLLHAEGQKILNLIADTLINDVNGKTTDRNVKVQLASRLEKWYEAYKENWRKTSRESELYRVTAVIFWYADMLRK